ncbi:hypothetical protein ACLB2K_070185 [Fragaria x ananassa]
MEYSCFQFSDLENPRKYLPPLDIPECFLGAEFLISSDTELQILLRYYGIERMGKAHFYKQQVLNRVGELQPALYCFNDSVFSPQDLYAISNFIIKQSILNPI